MDKPTDRTIFQNAWVVTDVEAACMKWVNEMGVGPFFITDYTPEMFDSITYRGAPAELSMRIGIAQAGPVQIELIQPLTEQCAYRDSVVEGESGFHHMCVWTHDFDADYQYFERLGYQAANTGRIGETTQFAYFDTRPLMGCMMEVVTYSDATAARFKEFANAAEGWDGSNPLR